MGVALECLSDNSVWLGYYTVWVSWFRQNFLSFSVLKELFPRILGYSCHKFVWMCQFIHRSKCRTLLFIGGIEGCQSIYDPTLKLLG